MATIKLGAIVTDIRGKLGGHVFQKGNQSRVLKTGSIPRKTQTVSNRRFGNNVKEVRSTWVALTTANKERWEQAATGFKFPSTFGDTITPTGYQLFQKLNSRLRRVNQPVILFPTGLQPDVVSPSVATWVMDITAETLTPSIGGSYAGTTILMEASWNRRYRAHANPKTFHYLRHTSSFTNSGSFNYSNFVTYFGQPSLSDTIFVRYCLVNSTGFSCPWFTSRITIQ